MSHPGIQLIVGLGNPGPEYEETRHNAGAWFVSDLARDAKVSLRMTAKFQGYHAIAKWNQNDCHLLIPTTYMNLSGQAVKALSHFFKIEPKHILIAHDEIDLPVGSIRLKFEGGAGGHNGLLDVINHLHTKAFYRLRIGVDRPKTSQEVVDYVLKPPKKMEREAIDEALRKAEAVMPLILEGHFQKAMHRLHSAEK